LRLPTGAPPL